MDYMTDKVQVVFILFGFPNTSPVCSFVYPQWLTHIYILGNTIWDCMYNLFEYCGYYYRNLI